MLRASLEQARAAKAKLKALLAENSSVVGFGLARFGPGWGVKVLLARELASNSIPHEIDGVPVRYELVGAITKRRLA